MYVTHFNAEWHTLEHERLEEHLDSPQKHWQTFLHCLQSQKQTVSAGGWLSVQTSLFSCKLIGTIWCLLMWVSVYFPLLFWNRRNLHLASLRPSRQSAVGCAIMTSCVYEGKQCEAKRFCETSTSDNRSLVEVAMLFLMPDLRAVTTLLFDWLQLPLILYIICCYLFLFFSFSFYF